MNSVDALKRKMWSLYITHPEVHINLNLKRPRTVLTNLPAVIKGVYPHVFQIEYNSLGIQKVYTHQYNGLITKEIEILELADHDNK